ncbi:MAG: hypothetical protein LBJ00_01470 [Planctomycetaceae bacterium]|nr:hypothetical protein [Planctomycetaceae bacterium]
MLICSKTGKEIVLPKVRKTYYENETVLGFSASGDLFCGTPCLNPLLALREIDI